MKTEIFQIKIGEDILEISMDVLREGNQDLAYKISFFSMKNLVGFLIKYAKNPVRITNETQGILHLNTDIK